MPAPIYSPSNIRSATFAVASDVIFTTIYMQRNTEMLEIKRLIFIFIFILYKKILILESNLNILILVASQIYKFLSIKS
jgi:hypothetical protein